MIFEIKMGGSGRIIIINPDQLNSDSHANLYTIVCEYASPGFKTFDGKFDWFTAFGKP